MMFHSSSADIVIYGGAAGGGKSYSLLLEPLRYMLDTPGFGAVIFRRNSPQITNEGSLWDSSQKMYGPMDAVPNLTNLRWDFKPHDNSLRFSHLEYEQNVHDWDGAQIPLIEFDELQHFTKFQFIYMMSRNRTTCGIMPYIRASCNPEPDSWILELIGWWIDADGYPIKARNGIVKYFVTINDQFVVADTKKELLDAYPDVPGLEPKSFTFINADLSDNKILTTQDPGYRANLMALPEHERERLLKGNWKYKKRGKMFKSEWFRRCAPSAVPSLWQCGTGLDPSGGNEAGNDEQGIMTVGRGHDQKFYVLEDSTCKETPTGWAVQAIGAYKAHRSGAIIAENNFGGAMVESNIKAVDPNVRVVVRTASRGKAVRAEPIAALYEQGMIVHVGVFRELENELIGFDPSKIKKSPNRLDALVWAILWMLEESDDAIFKYYKDAASNIPEEARKKMEQNMAKVRELLSKVGKS